MISLFFALDSELAGERHHGGQTTAQRHSSAQAEAHAQVHRIQKQNQFAPQPARHAGIIISMLLFFFFLACVQSIRNNIGFAP